MRDIMGAAIWIAAWALGVAIALGVGAFVVVSVIDRVVD
jgi:hypothetical protein